MDYSDKITYALDNDELYKCILGLDKYLIMDRDAYSSIEQDYNILIRLFDEYDKAHPGKMLRSKYEEEIIKMLNEGNIPVKFRCSKCVVAQMKKYNENGFEFKLNDPKRVLTLVDSTLKNNEKDIIENLNGIMYPKASENTYREVKEDFDSYNGKIQL